MMTNHSKLKVLVACECSGRVRDAFIAAGHDAISCDILPSETPGPHHQGDVLPLLRRGWDLVIAHPPCTFLCNSGVRWLHERPGRWQQMEDAAEFFLECLCADAEMVAVENPVMHGYAQKIIGRPADFSIQPWMFGDNFKKRTCFHTRNLPPLRATSTLDGSTAIAECHLCPPGANRASIRSRTYPGIANAMPAQWGFNRCLPTTCQEA